MLVIQLLHSAPEILKLIITVIAWTKWIYEKEQLCFKLGLISFGKVGKETWAPAKKFKPGPISGPLDIWVSGMLTLVLDHFVLR